MADLTDEMKEFLNSNLAWVATISKEGQVDLGPKMSMFIIDNNHIGYHERTAGQTYRNLLDGSDLVVAVANLEQKKGYRFRGNVVLHSDDAIYDEQVKVAEERGTKKPMTIPVLEITEIQDLRYPIDYNIEAIKSLIRRAMYLGYYEGVNLSLAYCDDCGHQELEMDVCPVCGSLLSERKIANLQHIVRGGSTMDSYTAVACMGCG